MDKLSKIFNPVVRKWLYGITAAGIAIGVSLGYIPAAMSPSILVLVMALLNVTSQGDPKQ